METIGYIGYAVLLALAASWTFGVRVKLDAEVSTILGALFFVMGAFILAVTGPGKLHSLWVIPAGFIFAVLMAYFAAHVPLLFGPFRLLASVFARVVRIGIPSHQILAAQEAGLKTSIEKSASEPEEK